MKENTRWATPTRLARTTNPITTTTTLPEQAVDKHGQGHGLAAHGQGEELRGHYEGDSPHPHGEEPHEEAEGSDEHGRGPVQLEAEARGHEEDAGADGAVVWMVVVVVGG